MKQLVYILMILSLSGCITHKKIQIEPIFMQPARVKTHEQENGHVISRSTYIEKTIRKKPAIIKQLYRENKLTFLLQGNISSGGHTINQVKNIRFENGEQFGDTITLKYFVEIIRIPGKEGANVAGYNYIKEESYNNSKQIKFIKIELYHERQNQDIYLKDKEFTKKVAQQTFNFL